MTLRVIAFGEALIDVYADRSVVAGAPLHVAAHLATRGWTSYLITRLGDDADGARVRRVLERCGVDQTFVETDTRAPTGRVAIDFGDEGAHTFTIQHPAAWDFVEGLEVPGHDVLYYGTLAGRSPIARETLLRLLDRSTARFRAFDVNLRPPDVDVEVLRIGLAVANLVKVNDDEMADVAGRLGIGATAGAYFHAAPDLTWLCRTRGAHGAEIHARDGSCWSVDAPRVEVVDTVGSGDAFAAGLIDALCSGGGPDSALSAARDLASEVLSSRGGLPGCASAPD